MNKGNLVRTIATCVLAITSVAGAQISEDYQIDNQRLVEVETASWKNLYVGKYTQGNGLIVSDGNSLSTENTYVGYTDNAYSNFVLINGNWNSGNLTIGTTGNSNNTVGIVGNGILELDNTFTVNGISNENSLMIADGGTLYIKSDFSADQAGFNFNSGGVLKTSATLSDIDQVENGRNLVFSGANAQWLRGTNAILIGANSSSNSISLEEGASMDFVDLAIGSASTSNNSFHILSGSSATVSGNLAASPNNFVNIDGGTLMAYGAVSASDMRGAGTFTLTGENAVWNNNGTALSIDGTDVLVNNRALLTTDSILLDNGSSLELANSGKVVIEGDGSVLANDSNLSIERGGWLTFTSSSDFPAVLDMSGGSLTWLPGGTVEFMGGAPIFDAEWAGIYQGAESNVVGRIHEYGTLFVNNGRNFIISSGNGYWAAAAHNLHVGDISANNLLAISNGASANVKSVSIGDFKEKGNNNTVLVSGEGSVFDSATFAAIGGTMIEGAWHDGGYGNLLRVEDGALFQSQSLHNRNGSSGLEIASGALVDVENYYQGAGAYLTIITDNTGTNIGLLQATTAEFEAGARVGVDTVSTMLLDSTYTNNIVEAGTLIVGGVTNGTTADLANLGASGGSLVNYNLLLENGTNIVAIYSRRYLGAAGGFDPNSILMGVSQEIEILATNGNAAARKQLDILNTMDDQAVKSEMQQLYIYQLPTFMHNQGVFGGIDQVRARGTGFRGAGGAQPSGAAGPHTGDQDAQFWLKAYGAYGDRDSDGGNPYADGYDVQAYGTVLGLDRSFGQWLFGIAGGYAGSNIEGENGDTSDADTGYGIVYTTYGTNDWFGDLVLSLGVSDIDNESGTAFDVKSNTKATQGIGYLGVGKQFTDAESGATLRPVAGLQLGLYDQDAYTEESANAVAKDVAAYDRWSYQSIVGCSLNLPQVGKKVTHETQWRAFWLHEFNDDETTVDYTLVGSQQPGQFIVRSPDQDVAQLGFGYVADWRNGFKLRANIDGQVSETFYSATVSGSLLYEF